MKVVKREDVSNWNYPCHCARCNSDLIVEGNDLRHKTEKKYGNDPRDPGDSFMGDTYFAYCAVCQNVLTVPEGKIPYLLRSKAKNGSLPSSGYKD